MNNATRNARQPDLRKLAQRQRFMIWIVALSILSNLMPFLFMSSQYQMLMAISFLLMQILMYVAMVVGVGLMLSAQGRHSVIIVLCALVMLAPCVNLLLLVGVNISATRALRGAGLRVGFWGVNDRDVERVLNPSLCRACGYDLTGNVSGVCPECGQAVTP